MKTIINRFPDSTSLSDAAAAFTAGRAVEVSREKGWCSVMLSGGTTPIKFYERLASPAYNGIIPWRNVHFFWGDERCVPPGHSDSNYHAADSALLSRLPVYPGQVHRIQVESGSPEDVADAYEGEMRALFLAMNGPFLNGIPRFDLVLLGIGPDGHTASLFPGDTALDESTRLFRAVTAPAGFAPALRITATLPLINSADTVVFLASGRNKSTAVASALSGKVETRACSPAAMVAPQEALVWFIDDACG